MRFNDHLSKYNRNQRKSWNQRKSMQSIKIKKESFERPQESTNIMTTHENVWKSKKSMIIHESYFNSERNHLTNTNTEHKATPWCRLKVIQDMPRLMNKKPTQNTKQNHMSIKKKVAEGHLPKYKTCPQQLNSSKITRHAPTDEPETNTEHKTKPYACYKKVAGGHLSKYKTCPQRIISEWRQDVPQQINKKPTQNTKQNHMPIKKEGGRMPPSKIQDMHPTTKLSKNTRLAPIHK